MKEREARKLEERERNEIRMRERRGGQRTRKKK
jgi:hypothetical protein